MQWIARLGLVSTFCLGLLGCGAGDGPTAAPAPRMRVDGGYDFRPGGGIVGRGSDEPVDEPGDSEDTDADADFIVGSWSERAYEDCSYTYRFTSSGGLRITSEYGEVLDGEYEIDDSAAGNRWFLTLIIEDDNGGFDCGGNTGSDAGITVTIVVAPSGRDKVNVYSSEYAGGASIQWNRK